MLGSFWHVENENVYYNLLPKKKKGEIFRSVMHIYQKISSTYLCMYVANIGVQGP